MRIHKVYSEFGGYEFMLVRKPSILDGIMSKIEAVSTKRFRQSVAASANADITNISLDAFLSDGWSSLRTKPDTSSSAEFVGLIKNRIALFFNSTEDTEGYFTCRDRCHALYVRDEIDVGIEILPMKSLQAEMSSGPGYYKGELYNVIRNGRGVPAVPLVMIGVAP